METPDCERTGKLRAAHTGRLNVGNRIQKASSSVPSQGDLVSKNVVNRSTERVLSPREYLRRLAWTIGRSTSKSVKMTGSFMGGPTATISSGSQPSAIHSTQRCEQRSGEIRFSNSTSSQPQRLCLIFLLPFSAQKSHVKSQNHLTLDKSETSAWHVLPLQSSILDIGAKSAKRAQKRNALITSILRITHVVSIFCRRLPTADY
jgi:hypothetical protein